MPELAKQLASTLVRPGGHVHSKHPIAIRCKDSIANSSEHGVVQELHWGCDYKGRSVLGVHIQDNNVRITSSTASLRFKVVNPIAHVDREAVAVIDAPKELLRSTAHSGVKVYCVHMSRANHSGKVHGEHAST